MKDVAIIGGGILGLAIGFKLSSELKGYQVSLFEKENQLGTHQSGNNSGVLHCGLYYQPGSLKAQLAVDGIRTMINYCEKNKINHDVCGKVVVASNEREETYLDNLAKRGSENGLKGLKYLNQTELKQREPYVKSRKTLLVPEEGIVDYKAVMNSFSDYIQNNNGKIYLNSKVLNLKLQSNSKYILETKSLSQEFDLVINCSGLFSDRNFEKLTHQKSPIKIIPFRGEYMKIKDKYNEICNHLIYPVPDPNYPFLGVHFTRMINGQREVGPNAVLALKREGYSNKDFSLKDTFETLTYKGFLNFMTKNFKFAVGEFASSISTKEFVKKAKKLIPDVDENMFEKVGTAGVRAQAIDKDGALIMDFRIEKIQNQIHVLNAPSPGATASLAIAEYIIDKYIKN
jgi:(S)-2-hydroxyglutarate dehydrogenase